MTVTLTLAQLSNDLRIGTLDTERTDILTRYLAAATAIVERRAPNAPDDVHNVACGLLCAFWYDAGRMSNAFKFSGAYDLLRPWIRTTAVKIASAD